MLGSTQVNAPTKITQLPRLFNCPSVVNDFPAACKFRAKPSHWTVRVLSRFLLAASDVGHFPSPSLPEIAFLGRSNVGKSSVINSLVGTKLARTSSTPGRTRAINFFELRMAGRPRPELIFTDLPGYG